ncbi:MAG: SulP family inorganic anion transporter, partial [Burkholderiaceae bacterium]|nr:SulP family inorganic anion transporter [Burkholderiaceae bacterium]
MPKQQQTGAGTSTTGRVVRPGPAQATAGWGRWFPGIQTVRSYEMSWLRHDLVAGLALTAVLVPVGIAYAVASGLPGICGLYATVAGLLAYALFGPSRILVLGPDSSLAALILAVVLPLSAGDPQRAVALAGMMALVSGVLCVAAGVARLGFVTELLSKPIRYGYMNGIALTVIASQLPALFGFGVDAHGLLDESWQFGLALRAGNTNPLALAIGAGTLLTILVLRRYPRLPGVLVAVVGATGVVTLLDLASTTGAHAGVPVLGALPQGLPGFSLPSMGANDIAPVLLGGLAVALISFADTS